MAEADEVPADSLPTVAEEGFKQGEPMCKPLVAALGGDE